MTAERTTTGREQHQMANTTTAAQVSRREQRRRQHHELSRAQLLDAAEEVFGRKGFYETTLKFKCDVIIGVPTGYELTATTKPYMRSTFALVYSEKHPEFKAFKGPEDLLALPQDKLHKMRIGIFGHSPAADWLLAAGLIEQAEMYQPQSGDPKETANTIVARDLASGKIDVAVVWGPIAGQLVRDHSGWTSVPFKPDAKIKFDYEMAMGLRQGEKEWQETLDQWIGSHHEQINQILTAYRIPLLELTPAKPGA